MAARRWTIGLAVAAVLMLAGAAHAQECCICNGCSSSAQVCFDEVVADGLTIHSNPADFPTCSLLCTDAGCSGFSKTPGVCAEQTAFCPQGRTPAPATSHGVLLGLAAALVFGGAALLSGRRHALWRDRA